MKTGTLPAFADAFGGRGRRCAAMPGTRAGRQGGNGLRSRCQGMPVGG